MAIVKLAHNATVAKLIEPTDEVAAIVSELLSYTVDGADRMFSVNQGHWDGRSSFYSYSSHTFPAGFAYMVHAELMRRGHTVHLIRKPHADPQGPENPIVDEFGNDDPRYDYQMRALRQVEKHGRGIIRIATGGGKSKVAKLIMARYRRMTLFLTTRGVLLYQMKDQLDGLGLNTGIIGDGEFKVTRGVNLGMVQTLVQAVSEPSLDEEVRAVVKSNHRSRKGNPNISRDEVMKIAQARYDEKVKRRRQFLKILEMVEVVIGEEAHEVGGNSYFTILQHCKNASIRVALTATPFMRDSAEDNMRLMAAFGPILINVSEEELIRRGILAQPFFKFVDVAPHAKLRKHSPWERAYQFGYIENEHMHEALVNDARKAKAAGLPVLTLVLRKKHGELLKELYDGAGVDTVFLRGENDNEERKRALAQLRNGEIDCIVGTTILDVGVDVPAIALLQLAGGGKAEVATRQRIGRALRAKKAPMPNVAFVADYSCNLNNTLREHAKQRRMIIEGTPGFVENILPAGEDFDWTMFEQRKAA